MIYFKIFLAFLQIGLLSLGGGYATIPLIHAIIVENNQWIDQGTFANLVAVAEITPGPIGVNAATFVGMRLAGFMGAITATFAVVLPSCILMTILAWALHKYKKMPWLDCVLANLRPLVVALIMICGITMFISAVKIPIFPRIHLYDIGLAAISFLLLRKYKLNPILLIIITAIITLAVNTLQEFL